MCAGAPAAQTGTDLPRTPAAMAAQATEAIQKSVTALICAVSRKL